MWRTAVDPHARAVTVELVCVVLDDGAHCVVRRVVPAGQVHMHLRAHSARLSACTLLGFPVTPGSCLGTLLIACLAWFLFRRMTTGLCGPKPCKLQFLCRVCILGS